MCENAYQHTREMLWKNREEISRKLVKSPPSGKNNRFAVANLHDTLDGLERYLKVAAG